MRSRHSCDTSKTLDLSTEQSFLWRLRAVSNATLPMRSISDSVYAIVLTPRFWPVSVSKIPLGLPKYMPPVSSRTTIISTPSTTSRFRVEASINWGIIFAGRKLANNSNPARNPSKPASGRK